MSKRYHLGVFLAFLAGIWLMDDEPLLAQTTYQKPPPEVRAILDVPPTPSISVSPKRDRLLLLQGERYPPIADLAAPMLRLAGLRVDPRNNGPHARGHWIGLKIMTIADGKTMPVDLPKHPKISALYWSPDGKQFAFTQTTDTAIELWLGDTATGKTRQVEGLKLNTAYGDAVRWLPGSKMLLIQLVPDNRGQPPAKSPVPTGPKVMESSGKTSPVRTYQDLLHDEHDQDLFDYHATSQLATVDTSSVQVTALGKPAVIRGVEASPDGKLLLVTRVHRPYSYLLPASHFPHAVEVWDLDGRLVRKLASLPLAEEIPIEGVPTGPRHHHWIPTAPATVVWVEALDGGDPRKKVPHRDKLLRLAAPFRGEPVEWFKTEQRFAGISWTDGDRAFVRDYDRDRRWKRTFLVDADNPANKPRLIWSLSIHDRYKDPGLLVMRTLPTGHRVVHQHQGAVFLDGKGSTPGGDRPFLDRMDLETLKTTRLFHCAEKTYEDTVALLEEDGSRFLTHYESPAEPPNFFVRRLGEDAKKALTDFPDPMPQLRKIHKELVRYKRPDGVELSFTLYLPADYQKGQRLPAVVWAYPLEYTDPGTAGQVKGSPYRFTTIGGPSHLFFLTQGYAVLDGATMPVVGDPETVNNTYIQQITASAKAAIDKADEMGVIDPRRVGVGGHSYGAFMTANLLAHCDLFRAGIARSGAYNRTLTPFGFQSERRTLWEAPEVYFKMSPFTNAHKIKAPLLLIHGEADNNSGTFPLQSERMYHAIKGNGGTVRLVVLPHEAHAYLARESVEHTLHEMIAWFEHYVKDAK
jgi:dipeptidyl aminopeptidase/acylaminoacyl peptidase